MARYDIVHINFSGLIESTSSNILDWAEGEMRNRLLRWRISRGKYNVSVGPNSERGSRNFSREFDDLVMDVSVSELAWDLLAQLLQQGWEPFTANDNFAAITLRWRQDN
jgi:hypothetical protein